MGSLRRFLLANFPVGFQSGAGGDQTAHDDVFFEPEQVVHLAGSRCVGEYLGGLLKGRCRNETLGTEGGLGNAE